jgi:hypothetical protein
LIPAALAALAAAGGFAGSRRPTHCAKDEELWRGTAVMRVAAIFALAGFLAAAAAPGQARPDFSGEWTLAAATTNLSRGGGSGEQHTSTYLSEGSAFNCGRGCRIVQKGSTLTVDNAQLRASAPVASPAVTIVADGASHAVVDSIDLGKTIDATARWENGKLVITSMLIAIPMTQTISLDHDQLVVVKPSVSSNAILTLRYSKK